jgi:hypothetical protein
MNETHLVKFRQLRSPGISATVCISSTSQHSSLTREPGEQVCEQTMRLLDISLVLIS